MNEFISQYKVLILVVTLLIAVIIYVSNDETLRLKIYRVLFGKNRKEEEAYEFDFIEGRNDMEVVIALEQVVELENATSIEESADIIWSYKHATGETEVIKDTSSPAKEILNELFSGPSEVEEEKVAIQNRIWLRPESKEKLGEEYKDYVPPSGDHSQIEDDMELAEQSKEHKSIAEDQEDDLSDIGNEQVL